MIGLPFLALAVSVGALVLDLHLSAKREMDRILRLKRAKIRALGKD